MTEIPANPMSDTHEAFEAAQQEDYFGFQAVETFYFPDGQTYMTFERMNEGKKKKFQKSTGRDLVLERQSGNARLKVDPGGDRHELIIASVTGWNLKRGPMREPVLFSERNLRDFLELANPVIVEDLEKAIRKANPWLMAEMSSEDIDKEIENLKEMREVALKRESGEASSSSR